MAQPYEIPGFERAFPRRRWTPLPGVSREIAGCVAAFGWDEGRLCAQVARALGPLLEDRDWLPSELRQPAPSGYRRELIYEAEDGSFSIGCFVWGVGQQTPIHDHRCWGVMGVAIGAVASVSFYPLQSGALVPGPVEETPAGSCAWIHPQGGDIHRVGAAGDETAVSIHVYGTRFGRVCRNRYRLDGAVQPR